MAVGLLDRGEGILIVVNGRSAGKKKALAPGGTGLAHSRLGTVAGECA
jgi:hypothetical protein